MTGKTFSFTLKLRVSKDPTFFTTPKFCESIIHINIYEDKFKCIHLRDNVVAHKKCDVAVTAIETVNIAV